MRCSVCFNSSSARSSASRAPLSWRSKKSLRCEASPCWKPCLPSPANADVRDPSPGDADVVGLSPMGRGAKRFGRGSGRIASPAQRERPTTEGRRVRDGAHVAQPPCWKPCLPSPADADVVGPSPGDADVVGLSADGERR